MSTKSKAKSLTIPISEVHSTFGCSTGVTHFDSHEEAELIRMHLKVKELRAIIEELFSTSIKTHNKMGSLLPHDALKIELRNLEENNPVRNILDVLSVTMLAAYDGDSIKVSIKKE